MANYGPPGGPYPGPPPEPLPDPDRWPSAEYGQPVDPWGDQDQLTGPGQPAHPPYSPTRQHDADHAPSPRSDGPTPFDAPPPGWAPPGSDPVWAPPGGSQPWPSAPDPPPRGGGARVFVGVLAALALLLVGGAALGIHLFGERNPSTSDARPTGGPTGAPPAPTAVPTWEAPTSAAPAPSTDARFVKAGQCVANKGTEAKPVLVIADCVPRTYEVLARYNGATTGDADAKAKCARVENYTNYYFFNSQLDDLDFVLCLRQR